MEYKNNDMLIFCGQFIKDNIILNDLQINKNKDEYLYYLIFDGKETKIFNIILNNIKTKIYICDYWNRGELYERLQKYISIYYKIPKQNLILYFNGKYLEISHLDDYYKAFLKDNSKYIELKYISDLEYINIYIIYKENKWKLDISRLSNKYDILYYLSKKYPFSYDKENDHPILNWNNKINIINESKINDGETVYLELIPSLKSIYKKKTNESFIINIQTLTGKNIPVEVFNELTI